jgi:hypothetical protein
MKITANLSFFLCISSVLMPVIEASTKGFRKLSAAKKGFTSIKRQGIFDFAAAQQQPASITGLSPERSAAMKRAWKHQQRAMADVVVHQHHRGLQTTDEDLALCELGLTIFYGPNSGCTCTEEEPSTKCVDFIFENCNLCDTLLDEQACIPLVPEIAFDGDSFTTCFTYESGPFDTTKICEIERFVGSTCNITIDGAYCSFCTVIDCDGATDYDIDCSNIIAGETWNLCTDNIPETSPFIAGNNDRFIDLSCVTGSGDLNDLLLASCQATLEEEFGGDSPCTCFLDAEDFIDFECDCVLQACETLQDQDICVNYDEVTAKALEAGAGPDTFAQCFAYDSGPFDNTICLIENFGADTCSVTIDGNECTSCTVVTCSETVDGAFSNSDIDFDCSNIIAGETWSLCSDDIPETSPFIAVGDNLLFSDVSCIDGSIGGRDSGGGGDTSGGVATSSHVLSLVGLIIVTSFW